MAQPQFPSRVYTSAQSPYANPAGAYLPPPTKRLKLSPGPHSPQSSPINQASALPNQVFSSPYAPNAQHPPFSTRDFEPPPSSIPAPSAVGTPYQAGAMGPPSRPSIVDKATDMSDLSDVLAGSGIDLKAEEAALVSRLNYEQQLGNSTAPVSGIYSPSLNGSAINQYYGNRVQGDILSRNIPGGRDSFYGAGTFNQPAVPYREDRDAAEEIRKQAIYAKAEREQYHLNNPFLEGANLSRRMFKQTSTAHVKVNQDGLFKGNQTSGPSTQAVMAGPDHNEILTVHKSQDFLPFNSTLTPILTLLSLACKERLRLVVEDAAILAHGRRTGAHGIVPKDLSKIAISNGPTKPVTLAPDSTEITGLSKTSLPNGICNRLRLCGASANKVIGLAHSSTSEPAVTDALIETVHISNVLAPYLQESGKKRQSAEERRLAKRQKRSIDEAAPAEASRANSISTSGPLGDQAPEIDTKKLSSKKELKRQENAKATEAQQHAATQQTMKMQLGGRSAQRSWMTNSVKPAGGTGFPVQIRKSVADSQARSATGTGIGTAAAQAGKRKAQDELREDREMGHNVQLRDVLLTLERDPKERKALARAYRRLDSKGGPRSETNMNGS